MNTPLYRTIFSFLVLSLIFSFNRALTQPQISGALTGHIGPGTFLVIDDIWIPATRTLIIAEGSEFIFQAGVEFSVYPNATLLALGTRADSVKFVNQAGSYWEGIFLNESNDSSLFRYCLITGSNITGIVFYNCSPRMENCEIRGNSAVEYAGGILCWEQACPIISNCLISNNSAWRGGGIRLSENSNAILTNCIIDGNSASDQGGGLSVHISNPIIKSCIFEGNVSNYEGGGIYYCGVNMVIRNCCFRNNQAVKGGAIFCWEACPSVYYNVFQYNLAEYGGGIYCQDGSEGEFMNNTFYRNRATINGGAIRIENSDPNILNNILTENSPDGVYFSNCPNASLDYCDIFDNSNNNFNGTIPPMLGIIDRINSNGDSCDFFYNIFLNPQFLNPLSNNFKLTVNSPCIDAGCPLSPLDPDSTIADIGAFYFDQSAVLPTLIIDVNISSNGTNIILHWSPVTSVIYYEIYRSANPHFDIIGMQPYAIVTEPSFTDVDTRAEVKYYYKVTTVIQ